MSGQFSFPWTSASGDRAISSEQQRALNASLVSDGVLEDFAATVDGTTISVTSGSAMIKGAYFDVGTGQDVSLSAITGASARLVARYDLTARSITLVAIEGNPTQSGGVWELPLATLTYNGSVWSQPTFFYQLAECIGSDPAGSLKVHMGESAPRGYLVANGAAVPRASYPRLFAAIGTTYGNGDGTSTFNLPDLRGRTVFGMDTGQSEFNTLGETGGEKAHVLSAAEMPQHTHTTNTGTWVSQDPTGGAIAYGADGPNISNITAQVTSAAGTGAAHNNLPPYITALVCIKV